MRVGNHFTAIISPGVVIAANLAVRRHAFRGGMLRREGTRRA
jgi:hypothetical protein